VTKKDPDAAIRRPAVHNSSLRHNNHPNNLNVIQPFGVNNRTIAFEDDQNFEDIQLCQLYR
jgi:hypothetical protein